MYRGNPHQSGRFIGAGPRQFRPRISAIRKQGRNFPDVHLQDPTRIKREVPDFDPDLEFEYTQRELLLLAEKMLLEDEKPPYEEPAWLNGPAMRDRVKREIYCSAGTPDPSIVEGMYWRTHPEGRPWLPDELRRATGGGFYGHKTTGKEAVPAPPKRIIKKCRFEGGCPKDAVAKGLCYRHRQQEKEGKGLRPIKRSEGLSKHALRWKETVDRMEAKKRPAEASLSIRLSGSGLDAPFSSSRDDTFAGTEARNVELFWGCVRASLDDP